MVSRWGRQERKQGRGVTYDIRQEAGPQNRSAPARQTWKQSIAGGGNSRWVIGAPAPGLTARLEGRGEEAGGGARRRSAENRPRPTVGAHGRRTVLTLVLITVPRWFIYPPCCL